MIEAEQRKEKSEILVQVLVGDTVKVRFDLTFKRSNVAKTWQSYKENLRKSNLMTLQRAVELT